MPFSMAKHFVVLLIRKFKLIFTLYYVVKEAVKLYNYEKGVILVLLLSRFWSS